MKTKRILIGILSLVIALSAISLTALADDAVSIMINGEYLEIPEGDVAPFIENNRTLVPMRIIFEALGADVDWDGDTKTVTAYDYYTAKEIKLQIGSETMFINDEPVTLDVPAKIVNNRTVVPARAVAEALDSDVGWDGDTKTVIITKEYEPDYLEFATLDELNAALSERYDYNYHVTLPSESFEINSESGIVLVPALGETLLFGSIGDISVTAVTAPDIYVFYDYIFSFSKVDELEIEGLTVNVFDLSSLGEGVLLTWVCDDGFSHAVEASADGYDFTKLLETAKSLVGEIEKHPESNRDSSNDNVSDWTDSSILKLSTIDELNNTVGEYSDIKYYQLAPSSEQLKIYKDGYVYDTVNNVTIMYGKYTEEDRVTFEIMTSPTYPLYDYYKEMLKDIKPVTENIADCDMAVYVSDYYTTVLWQCTDGFDHVVSFSSPEFDTLDIAKELAEDVENHPKG